MSLPLTIGRIRTALAGHHPQILAVDRPHAAVAMILTGADAAPQVLFILRARHDGDPWSGNIAFPGGRVDRDDDGPRAAAERETREELGLDLNTGEYLGRLDDLYGATLPIMVSCFVYRIADLRPIATNHEIDRVFCFPLNELGAPGRHRTETFLWRDMPTTQPVVELLPPGEPLLWGITYRLLQSFFAIFDLPFRSRDS